MNCRDFRNLILIGVHGRLTPDERKELDRHRAECDACAALHEQSMALMDVQEKSSNENASVPLPDWEKSWALISEKALPRKSPRSSFFSLVLRWAPAAASILLVFALGYFFGRRFLVKGPASGSGIASAVTADQPSPLLFANYADNLKPVLINFLNRSDVRPPEELRALEREIIRDILSRTRLLRSLAAESEDAALGDLLLDLEFILASMANLAPDDTESADHLKRMIREKDIPLRLRELASPATI